MIVFDRPDFNHSSGATTSQTVDKDCIDEHLFIEALALAAFEIVYREPQPTSVEKVSSSFFT